MRDIKISQRQMTDGKASFSIKKIEVARGIDILVEKVTKAIFSKTKNTPVFNAVGMDAYSFISRGTNDSLVQQMRVQVMATLRSIQEDIVKGTPKFAPQSEQLSDLVLDDLYATSKHELNFKIRIYPRAGSPEYVTFPVNYGW